MFDIRKNRAFTIPEISVTFFVIFIFAVLIIPFLTMDYKKSAIEIRLKNEYDNWNDAIQKMMKEEKVKSFSNTAFARQNNGVYQAGGRKIEVQDLLLRKYLQIVSIEDIDSSTITDLKNDNQSGESFVKLHLVDGSNIYMSCTYLNKNESNYSIFNIVNIDINGDRAPNKYGKDVFAFYISKDGMLKPLYGLNYAKDSNNMETYWKNNEKACGKEDFTISKMPNTVEGQGCAARIIENEWEIDYY